MADWASLLSLAAGPEQNRRNSGPRSYRKDNCTLQLDNWCLFSEVEEGLEGDEAAEKYESKGDHILHII